MKITSFIITLTGSSASGKSYISNKIKETAEDFNNFVPVNFPKYTTREYRKEEISQRKNGKSIDVVSVDEIPSECDLVYRTYGNEYGLKTKELERILQVGKSPIVVINDVRAVEELKRIFKGRVLSLFLFRHIPSLKEIKEESQQRGNISEEEIFKRYLKAIALYRIYIENITIFDKVILNVKDCEEGEVDYTKLQVTNILKGVFNKKILLDKNTSKGTKLFIVSGNSASGKDDIIQAVRKMGKLQADIITKYTSRKQLEYDGDEMVCRLIPKIDIVNSYKEEYRKEREEIENKFNRNPSIEFVENCRNEYNKKNRSDNFEEFCEIEWNIARLKYLRGLDNPMKRFWKNHIGEESAFQLNNSYIDLSELKKLSQQYNKREEDDELCYATENDNINFIYVNHGKEKDGINYGFSIKNLLPDLKNGNKHRVLVASFVNIFEYCNEQIGKDNVVPIFTYSQISKEEFEKEAKSDDERKKVGSFDESLKKYAENIVDFDHVIIYAETQMQNESGGQKEEIIDQIFRLFRAYNV